MSIQKKTAQPPRAQAKAAAAPARPSPAAPAVYRPQPTPKVLQRKEATRQPARNPHDTQARPTPVAPPAYRPQPAPKVSQPKLPVTGPTGRNGLSREDTRTRPSSLPTRQAGTLQAKPSSPSAAARPPRAVVQPLSARPGSIIQAMQNPNPNYNPHSVFIWQNNPPQYGQQYGQQNNYQPHQQNTFHSQNLNQQQNFFHSSQGFPPQQQHYPPQLNHQQLQELRWRQEEEQRRREQERRRQEEELRRREEALKVQQVVKALGSANRLPWRVGDNKELEFEVKQYARAKYEKIKKEKEEYLEVELNNRHKTAWDNIVSGLKLAAEWNDPEKANSTIAITGSWHYSRFRKGTHDWQQFRTDPKTAVKLLNDLARTALNVYIGNARVNKGLGSITDYHDANDPMGLMKQHSGWMTPFSSALANIPTHSILTGGMNMSEEQYKDLHVASMEHYANLWRRAKHQNNDEEAADFYYDRYQEVKNTPWFDK